VWRMNRPSWGMALSLSIFWFHCNTASKIVFRIFLFEFNLSDLRNFGRAMFDSQSFSGCSSKNSTSLSCPTRTRFTFPILIGSCIMYHLKWDELFIDFKLLRLNSFRDSVYDAYCHDLNQYPDRFMPCSSSYFHKIWRKWVPELKLYKYMRFTIVRASIWFGFLFS
jgi:hypothetical protein